jgi:hypothetical protein
MIQSDMVKIKTVGDSNFVINQSDGNTAREIAQSRHGRKSVQREMSRKIKDS